MKILKDYKDDDFEYKCDHKFCFIYLFIYIYIYFVMHDTSKEHPYIALKVRV